MDVYDTGKVKIGSNYRKTVINEMSDEDIALQIALQNVLLQSVMLDKQRARQQFFYDAFYSVIVVLALAGLAVWFKS
jgi:hypothetical protein